MRRSRVLWFARDSALTASIRGERLWSGEFLLPVANAAKAA